MHLLQFLFSRQKEIGILIQPLFYLFIKIFLIFSHLELLDDFV